MVARITAGRSLRDTLQYNEQKVFQQQARLIHSVNFGKDTDDLRFSDKLMTLQKLASLNERTTKNCIHISLNFHPSEQLNEDTLRAIAVTYMRNIGFGDQPYLVYQHNDADHPHIHVVTTNIQRDGKRIALHNIGRNQSEKARKKIEQAFNLVRAGEHPPELKYELKAINAQKVVYGSMGKSGTKRAIKQVLDAIIPNYNYTSLPELNAVLQQYHVIADRGGKESRIYKNGGLVYRVLNEQGEKVGVPIPASHIYGKPTLNMLRQRFTENESNRQRYKLPVKNAVDLAIWQQPGLSLTDLTAVLKKENINLMIRRNEQGIVYGLTFIDRKNKCVFNGSDLGKPYSANQLQQRLGIASQNRPVSAHMPSTSQQQSPQVPGIAETTANMDPWEMPRHRGRQHHQAGPSLSSPDKQAPLSQTIKDTVAAASALLQPEHTDSLNPELRNDKKKRRKKIQY